MFDIGVIRARSARCQSLLDGLTEKRFTNIDLIMVSGALALVGLVGALFGVALIS